mmetsp:Transcript_36086/g.90098  ORF Transcript_36086/g.90098 Transcript_36086/m.90098 type:complete len:261 (-) Transcript_36086:2713-3495(-)
MQACARAGGNPRVLRNRRRMRGVRATGLRRAAHRTRRTLPIARGPPAGGRPCCRKRPRPRTQRPRRSRRPGVAGRPRRKRTARRPGGRGGEAASCRCTAEVRWGRRRSTGGRRRRPGGVGWSRRGPRDARSHRCRVGGVRSRSQAEGLRGARRSCSRTAAARKEAAAGTAAAEAAAAVRDHSQQPPGVQATSGPQRTASVAVFPQTAVAAGAGAAAGIHPEAGAGERSPGRPAAGSRRAARRGEARSPGRHLLSAACAPA